METKGGGQKPIGSYTVTLRVTDDNVPPKTDLATVVIDASLGNLAPIALPGGSYTIDIGVDLTLDGSASSDPNAVCGDSIVSYEWDLGADGSYEYSGAMSTVPWSALSNLPQDGTPIPIRLQVTDSFGLSHTADTQLRIYVNEPVAAFIATRNPCECNETVTFDARGSYNASPNADIVIYEWDIDYDGIFEADTAGATITHAYSQFGQYTVALRVTDDNSPGKTDVRSLVVNVNLGNRSPIAAAGGPYVLDAGTDLVLDGSGSSDPDTSCGDIAFNRDDPALASIVSDVAVGDGTGLSLRWLGLDGLRAPQVGDPVMLGAPTTVTRSGATLSIDFGSGGIVTNAPAVTGQIKGDGYYALDVWVSGSLLDTRYFFRLLGDVTGDGRVTDADYNLVRTPTNAAATPPTILYQDVNGSGRFDATGRSLVSARRSAGAAVSLPAPWTLDALRLAGGSVASESPTETSVPPLNPNDVSALLTAAVGQRQASGLGAADVQRLQQLEVRWGDLPGTTLGLYGSGVIYLDWTAANAGWFVDATPQWDEEYAELGVDRLLTASANSPAAGRVDLLTVLAHEMGHALSLEHSDDLLDLDALMGESLSLGQRKPVSGSDLGPLSTLTQTALPSRERVWDAAIAGLVASESDRPNRGLGLSFPSRELDLVDDFFADLVAWESKARAWQRFRSRAGR